MDEAGTMRKRRIRIRRERLWCWFHMTIDEATKQGEIDIKKRMCCLATGWGVGVGDQGEPLGAVGVDDSSNKAARQLSGRAPCMYWESPSRSYPRSDFTFSLPTEVPISPRPVRGLHCMVEIG